MATKIILIDDLDRKNGLEVDAAEKVSFGLDGKNYTVDLTEKHAAELREFLERYIQVGEPENGDQLAVTKRPGPQKRKAFHDWLRTEGRLDLYETKVPGKYRIPRTEWARYQSLLRSQNVTR